MPIEYVTGDLFVNRVQAQAFAHGCNCKGVMGSGIAVGFKKRYPAMFEEYRRMCKANPREFNPGDAFLWRTEDDVWVFNLATQENYAFWNKATIERVEKSLVAMHAQADEANVTSIAMPRIGAGLGGLKWDDVRAAIERVFSDWPGTLYVYEKFVRGQ